MKTEQTKKTLLIANTKLEKEIAELQELSVYKRKEFARAFGWNKQGQTYYDGEFNPRLPSWEEIFVEIGRLLSAQKNLQYISDVENLKLRTKEHDTIFKEHDIALKE